jgi:hypothetical protein
VQESDVRLFELGVGGVVLKRRTSRFGRAGSRLDAAAFGSREGAP